MSSIAGHKIEAALKSKGFEWVRRSDHRRLVLHVAGRQTGISTSISHSDPDYGDKGLAKVKAELGLSKKQLIDLVRCSLGYDGYVAILVANGDVRLGDAATTPDPAEQ